MSVLDEVAETLLYGSLSWLGILLYLTLVISLVLRWRYAVALVAPITLFLGIDYIENSLLYHAGIMFFSTIFMLILYYRKKLG